MSVYRMLRFTAVVALLRRFRLRLVRLLFAVTFALVTAWLYGDIATFIDERHPDWSGPALALKTVLIYLVLFYCIWEIHRMIHGDSGIEPTSPPTAVREQHSPGTLDQLADKPRLRSRRDEILERPQD